MVKKGEFREDLYYRLNVVAVILPPLRERKEDILELLDYYVELFSSENNLSPVRFSAEALKVLGNYSWPGNVRELRNYCESVVVRLRGGKITEYDLDGRFLEDLEEEEEVVQKKSKKGFSKEESEKKLILKALREAQGNKTEAARLLGVSRRTLHRKLDKWSDLPV